MKERYISAFVMLLAGAFCSVICVVLKYDITDSLLILLLVLVVFYLIGKICAHIVHKIHRQVQIAEEEQRAREEKEAEEAKKAEEEAKRLEQENENTLDESINQYKPENDLSENERIE